MSASVNVTFLFPLKTPENFKDFLMLSGGIEIKHWEEMGKGRFQGEPLLLLINPSRPDSGRSGKKIIFTIF